MSINDRLKQIIDIQAMSIKTFSEMTEIPYRSIQNYLREEREPNAEALMKISQKMNVNLNWLLLGEGEMFKQHNIHELSEKELSLILNYRSISNIEKRVFDISLESVASFSK